MKIIISKDTTVRFHVYLTYIPTNEDYTMSFGCLSEARDYCDWAENCECRIDQITVELE